MSSSPTPRAGIGHFPALDGLRGLAVLGVLLFHADGLLVGGYLGVDLFFVLSGFLITALLVAEHGDSGRIDLGAFWVRRARRLFPALLALMPAVGLLARAFARREELAGIRWDAIATLGYFANWRAVLSHKSYWELFAAPSPLEHTWSLSIEEQFYVVWPLIVALCLRVGGRRALLGVTLGLTALSAAAMLWLFDPEHTTRVYYGTDARATAILAGAALALVLPPGTKLSTGKVRALDVVGVAALVGLGFAWWTLEGEDPRLYRGGFWLTELGVVALIACALSGPRSLVARGLSLRPLTLVGVVSYGAYLWHWPLDVAVTEARVHLHGASLQALRLALTFALAAVSYRFLEQPIRRRGVAHPLVGVPLGVGVAVAAIVAGTHARPLPPPPPPPPPPVVVAPVPIRFRALMLGDSTANSLGWALRGAAPPGVVIENRGQDGFNLFRDEGVPSWGQAEGIAQSNAVIVFLGGSFLYGVHVRGKYTRACSKKWDADFEAALSRRLSDLDHVPGRVWVGTVPYPLGIYDNSIWRAQVDCINASIKQRVAADKKLSLLDVAETLCPKSECVRESNGKLARPDGVHYDIEGSRFLATAVLATIDR